MKALSPAALSTRLNIPARLQIGRQVSGGRYLTVPGVHQSCAVYLFLINRGYGEGMDEQTQNIIKACMHCDDGAELG